MAFCSAAAGAGAMRSTSLAQRFIVRSSRNAVFYVGILVRHFQWAMLFMSYRDGETIGRALECFETPFEGLCRKSPFRSAFLDEICFGTDQYSPEKALKRLIT